MEIKVDPANMTQEQRESVAGFILAYPGKVCAGSCEKHDRTVVTAHADVPPMFPALHPEIAALAAEDAEFDAAQAFGSVPPLPHGATAAPFTAVANPLPTAPVDTLETSSITPSSAPVPPVPTTSGAAPVPLAPAAPTNPVDVDKNGLPWDHRIHAESKAKIADGTWRAKRNCDPTLKATVEAELRQLMGVVPSVPLPLPVFSPVAPVTIPTPGAVTLGGPATALPMPIAPPPTVATGAANPLLASSAPVPTPSAPIDPKLQFVQLVGRASAAIQAKKITLEDVSAICQSAGVPALPLLANRLDLLPAVAAQIDALIGGL